MNKDCMYFGALVGEYYFRGKTVKMLKTCVKFLCLFGAMLLIFGLLSLRRVIRRCMCCRTSRISGHVC
jgi:hypothetical protein